MVRSQVTSLLGLALVCVSADVVAGLPTATAIAAKTQALYDPAVSYEADFLRTEYYPAQPDLEGHVSAQKGRLLRIEYAPPSKAIIMSDGSVTWRYDGATQTACSEVAARSLEPALFGFALQSGYLVKGIVISSFVSASIPVTFGTVYSKYPVWAIEAPSLGATASIGPLTTLVFGVYQSTGQVMMLAGMGPGTDVRYMLYNQQLHSQALPASTFSWAPPAGTTIKTKC